MSQVTKPPKPWPMRRQFMAARIAEGLTVDSATACDDAPRQRSTRTLVARISSGASGRAQREWRWRRQVEDSSPRGFEQEPRTPLRLVNPDFDQAGGCVIIGFADDHMRSAQALYKGLVVGVEFPQHLGWAHKLLVVVRNPLQPGNVSYGVDGCAADLANTLGYGVGDAEYLGCMFVEKQVVVAEMLPAHVPVEVFGLEIEGKCVGNKRVQYTGKILYIFG